MPYVIAEPCIAICDTACVDVCPVDAIAGPVSLEAIRSASKDALRASFPRLQLFINPDTCICCGACEPECPVGAIYEEDDLPAEWASYQDLNAQHFAGPRK